MTKIIIQTEKVSKKKPRKAVKKKAVKKTFKKSVKRKIPSGKTPAQIDNIIRKVEPKNIAALKMLVGALTKNYKIVVSKYMGQVQGVKVLIKKGTKTITIPGKGYKYGIFK
jgi:cystathionine beta-lyase family protein involved in aluminum resistance